MKTLTLNNKRILFGMLIVTLGFSKSWLLAADETRQYHIDMASEVAPAAAPVRPVAAPVRPSVTAPLTINRTVEVNGEDYAVDITLTSKNVDVPSVIDGVIGTKRDIVTEASFNDNGCTSCISGFELRSVRDTADLLSQLDSHFKKEKAKALKKEKEEKELEKAIANCEKMRDGDDIIDLEDDENSGKYYRCKAKKVKSENSDRKALRKAFRSEVVADIQRRLLDAQSPEELENIVASIDEIEKEVRGDSALKKDLEYLKNGANALAQIPNLALDSAMNPSNRLENSLTLDKISWDFNFRTNQSLNKLSDNTKSVIRSWSSVVPLATQAQKSPEQVAQHYFSTMLNDSSIMPEDGGRSSQNGVSSTTGSRFEREPMTRAGIRYIPRYLVETGSYSQNNDPRYNNDPRFNNNQQSQYNRYYQNPTPSSRFSQNNGTRFNPNASQYQSNNGIPQAGRRY